MTKHSVILDIEETKTITISCEVEVGEDETLEEVIESIDLGNFEDQENYQIIGEGPWVTEVTLVEDTEL